MKRTLIGGVIMLSGILVTISIIISAAVYTPYITSWPGNSKFWFAIFGAKKYGNKIVQSLFLGWPFVIGIVLVVIGLLILIKEYFTPDK